MKNLKDELKNHFEWIEDGLLLGRYYLGKVYLIAQNKYGYETPFNKGEITSDRCEAMEELVNLVLNDLFPNKSKENEFEKMIKERIRWIGDHLYIGDLRIAEVRNIGVDIFLVEIGDGQLMCLKTFEKAKEQAENYVAKCMSISKENEDD